MSRIFGYIRPQVNVKNMQSQVDQLKAAGATKIFQEQPAGTKRDRPQLNKLMADVRKGDTVVVISLNCVAHNTRHLLDFFESLETAGVTFKVIDHGIDTSTSPWKHIRILLGAITDFERKIVREWQADGIERAKREGRYKGRKPTARAKTEEVLALNTRGLTKQEIADQLRIGVASVYRILKSKATSQEKNSKRLKKPVDKQTQVKRKPKREPPAEQLSFF